MSTPYDEAAVRFDGTRAQLMDPEPELARLAALDPLKYDREREAVAERLGVRVATLDREVRSRRPDEARHGRCGQSIALVAPQRAADSVNGPVLCDRIVTTLSRHVVLPSCAADAVALWVFRAHAHDIYDVNPRLALVSPEKRCGKTTLLEILAHLVPNALSTSNTSAPVLFRVIEQAHPTLLIDEMDTFTDEKEELRGLLNSGHRRGAAYVLRCVGDEHEPRKFSTWAPMVLAAIGRLPATVADRCITIPMHRRAPHEQVTRLRWASRHGRGLSDTLVVLAGGCARWVADHADALRESEPDPPAELHDRAADNWYPLLAIADVLGVDWPERARRAALALSGTEAQAEEGAGVQVLADIKSIFDETGSDRHSSADLCDRLAALEERPWSEWRRGKPITPSQLARLLRPFSVSSRTLRLTTEPRAKGYLSDDFAEAWTRYINANPPSLSRDSVATRFQSGDSTLFQSVTADFCHASENPLNAAPDAACHAVTDGNEEDGRAVNPFLDFQEEDVSDDA